jgi:hypothetical protein
VALTLTADINSSDRTLQVTGDVTVAPGYVFRLDNELLRLSSFAAAPPIGSSTVSPPPPDPNYWNVQRGLYGSTAADHTAGAAILGTQRGWVVNTDQPPPPPFVGTGGSSVGVGFAWHWNLGSQTIAAGDTWTSSNAGAPTIDFDPQGFFDTDSSGAITPAEGGAGLYAVFVTAKFTSAVATGYVSVDAEGPAFKQAVPVRFDDGTNMHAIWQGLVDLGDGDNTLDVQHVVNESDHNITLIRVDVRVQRLAATPA